MSGTWVEVVKQRRAELRLSVRAAARRAGVSESLWRQMENGHRPKPENLASMSLALGWSASRGLSSVIDGAEPEPCAEGEAATIGRTLTTPQNLETRVGALEDQLRAVITDADDLVRRLEEGGHLTSLPTESAALANAIEVALCAYLIERCGEVDGAEVRRGQERSYPDLEFGGEAFGGGHHAVDIKLARLSSSGRRTQSRISLFTGNTFFRWPQIRWPGMSRPFEEYRSHLDIIGLYVFDPSLRGRVRNLELIVHEPWRIASRERSSTTREYLGAVDDVAALRAGRGSFETAEAFYTYWRSYPFRTTRAIEQQLARALAAQQPTTPMS